MRLLLIVILSVLSAGLNAQSIDELKEQLQSASDNQKANIENSLSEAYAAKRKYKKAEDHAIKAIELAKANGNSGEELRGNVNGGNAAKRNKNFDQAIVFFEQVLNLANKSGQGDLLAYAYESQGYCYSGLGEYTKSIKAYQNALKADDYSEKEQAKIFSRIGYNHYMLGELKQSISNYRQSDELFDKNPDPETQARMLINLAGVYANYGDYGKGVSTIDKAIELAQSNQLGGTEKAAQDAKRNIELKRNNKEEQTTAFDEELIKETEDYIEDIEKKHVKSLEEIENLSIENQVKELKLLNQQNQLRLKEQESAAQQQLLEKQELENARQEAEIKQVEAENARTLAWLVGAGIALILVLILALMAVRNNKKLKEKNAQIAEQNAELDKKNKNITESINYARKIQNALLASNLRLTHTFEDHLVFSKPRDIVSGDFSWCDAQEDSCVIAVADCTGHGVPGALMSVLAISSLEKIVKQSGIRKPTEILQRLNKDLHSLFGSDAVKSDDNTTVKDGMDIVVINVHRSSNKMEFAGSRNSLLKVSGGEVMEYKGSKVHLGYYADHSEFNHQDITLQKGDAVYLYSDGFYDQKGGPDGKKFYPKRFRELLGENAGLKMEAQRRKYEEVLSGWSQGYEQVDDILILGIRI